MQLRSKARLLWVGMGTTKMADCQSWVTAYIALGSNLGDRMSYLQAAADALRRHPDICCLRASSVYCSAPVGGSVQQQAAQEAKHFLNAVLQVRVRLPALKLLDVLQSLEQQAGRIRLYPDAPRTLDLDILLYDNRQINEPPHLVVPHPRMWNRAFVLYPLQELAPNLVNKQLLHSVYTQDCELVENVALKV